jgi:hypothetical protein
MLARVLMELRSALISSYIRSAFLPNHISARATADTVKDGPRLQLKAQEGRPNPNMDRHAWSVLLATNRQPFVLRRRTDVAVHAQ